MKEKKRLLNRREKKLLSSILWDTDINTIDIQLKKFAIIERILNFGRPEHLRWLFKNFSREDIINVIKTSSNLDKKVANFWAIHFNIPPEEILCFSKPSPLK